MAPGDLEVGRDSQVRKQKLLMGGGGGESGGATRPGGLSHRRKCTCSRVISEMAQEGSGSLLPHPRAPSQELRDPGRLSTRAPPAACPPPSQPWSKMQDGSSAALTLSLGAWEASLWSDASLNLGGGRTKWEETRLPFCLHAGAGHILPLGLYKLFPSKPAPLSLSRLRTGRFILPPSLVFISFFHSPPRLTPQMLSKQSPSAAPTQAEPWSSSDPPHWSLCFWPCPCGLPTSRKTKGSGKTHLRSHPSSAQNRGLPVSCGVKSHLLAMDSPLSLLLSLPIKPASLLFLGLWDSATLPQGLRRCCSCCLESPPLP